MESFKIKGQISPRQSKKELNYLINDKASKHREYSTLFRHDGTSTIKYTLGVSWHVSGFAPINNAKIVRAVGFGESLAGEGVLL